MKILLIQQKMIGDVLTSSILAEAIKAKHPQAVLDYLINSSTLPVVANHPAITNFILFTPEIENNYLKFYQFLKEIRNRKYTHVIDVYGKLSSNLISFFSNAAVKISYYKKGKSFIYTHNIPRIAKPIQGASLAIENRLRLLAPLDIDFMDISPKIYLLPNELENAQNILKASGVNLQKPLFMLSVLGSSKEKSYPSKYMAKLADFIIEKLPTAQLLFNYMPNQKEEAQKIYNFTLKQTKAAIIFELYAKNLRELLAITHFCQLVIGNEGGLINMAKALKVPTFIIFSPYLNKKNWFGENEAENNTAVHLSDFYPYEEEEDWKKAKADPEAYYKKFIPEYIEPLLERFIKKHNGL